MAVTPEVAAGKVFLPNPMEPGNEWVFKWLDEVTAFPTAKHDDQVDAFTMALSKMQVGVATTRSNPADAPVRMAPTAGRIISASRTGPRRSAGG